MVEDQTQNADLLRSSEADALQPEPSFYEHNRKSSGIVKRKIKKGPAIFIISIIFGFSGFLFLSQASLPFAIASRLISEFNTIGKSNRLRDKTLRRILLGNGASSDSDSNILDGKKYKNPIKEGIFGNKKLKLSRKQIKKLKNNGFEVEGEKLFFRSKGKNIEITADNIESHLKNDPDIRTAYLDSSKTWRGNIAGWFDTKVKGTLNRLGKNIRKRYHNWKSSGDDAADLENFKNITRNPIEVESESSGRHKTEEPVLKEDGTPELDSNGKPKMREVIDNSSSGQIKNNLSPEEAEVKAKSAVNQELDSASRIANLYCGVQTFLNGVNLLVSAYHLMEIIGLSSTFLESVHKVKAGEGSSSPLNTYMKTVLTKDKTGKSAMESYGMNALFGRKGLPSKDNRSATMASREGLAALINDKLGTEYKFDKNKYQECNRTKLAANTISVVSTVVGIVTLGVGAAIKAAVTTFSKNAVKLALAATIPILLPVATEALSKKLSSAIFGKVNHLGEEGGDALAAGGHMYLSENAKSGGQAPADKEHLIAFYRDVVTPALKEESAIARSKLSPFDISSEYTFLGSIFHNAVPVLASTAFGLNSFSALASVTKNSVASILPSAQAISENDLVKTEGDCPNLKTIGAVGDAFCNPYYITDSSTIDAHPGSEDSESIFNKVYELGKYEYEDPVNIAGSSCRTYYASSNFKVDNSYTLKNCHLGVQTDEEGNPVINPFSRLGAYVNFCGMRSSNLGAIDGNIASWVRHIDFKKGTIDNAGRAILENNAVSGIINIIPVLGDLVDIGESIKDMKEENVNWVNGQSCVASNDNPDWGREIKYYQRYSEDQRWLENAGVTQQSATSKVVEEYLALQPLDNSPAGMLSRFSGLTKNQVVATLNYLDYQIALQNYHPTELAPLPKPAKIVLSVFEKSHSAPAPTTLATLRQPIIYAPLRHRNYAI